MAAESFGNIFRIPELKKKILFTLALLVVYRIGAHIPTPGINSVALAELFARAQGTILGFFDMFSGGALSRLTIFALGIMPYISASIILQLMTIVSPYLARLKKEGEAGQKKNNPVHTLWNGIVEYDSGVRNRSGFGGHEESRWYPHSTGTRLVI
jgi:preprotein translocase subunit SecY